MKIKIKSIVAPVAILIFGLVFATLSQDARYVAAPVFVSFGLALWLWMTLWNRDKSIPLFDAGIFCALATLAYTTYPLMNYWMDGFTFGILSDQRLWRHIITPSDMFVFHLRHVLYMFCFVASYALFRGRGVLPTGNVRMPDPATRTVVIVLFVLLAGYFLLFNILTYRDFSSLATYGDKTARVVEVTSSLPRVFVQISDKLRNIFFLFKLSVLFFVVSKCKDRKWLAFLILWLATEIILTFVLKNTRTGLVFLLMSTVLLYHRMIRPLSMKFLCFSGALFFAFFNFLGLYRSYSDLLSFQNKVSQGDANVISGANEFQALFATAYDVLQLKLAGTELPWYLYINDIIAILPPQQIMPFEKIAAWEWYMVEIGMEGRGFGFMWGVISQAIVGFDWYELAFRGALLGLILALIHRWYTRHQTGFLETIVYIYLCLRVYYTFRDTTLSLLTFFVWDVVPFYLLLRLGALLVQRNNAGPPGHKIALLQQ